VGFTESWRVILNVKLPCTGEPFIDVTEGRPINSMDDFHPLSFFLLPGGGGGGGVGGRFFLFVLGGGCISMTPVYLIQRSVKIV